MANDQTSAVLYNYVIDALAEMELLPEATDPIHGEARVDHYQKVALLKHAADMAGMSAVVSIGSRIKWSDSSQAGVVFARATSPADLIKRWQRMEKIFHSRHRIQTLEQDDHRICLKHIALRGDTPGELEDLLIAGVVLALLTEHGCQDLSATFENGRPFVVDDKVVLDNSVCLDTSCTWYFSWTSINVNKTSNPKASVTGTLLDQTTLTNQIRGIFVSDPAASWTLKNIGEIFALSTRSIQRKLASEHTSFRVLLRELRADAAASLLTTTDESMAQIAFACGYADQPHYSKEFKRCIGVKPTQYRELIAKT